MQLDHKGFGVIARSAAVVSMVVVTAGCAGIHYKPATDPHVNGIRYYTPASYILIKPDYEKGTPSVTIFNGPDVTRPFAAEPFAHIATNDSLIEFQEGILSQVSSDADGSKLATSLITSAGALAQKVLENAAEQKELGAALAKAGAAAEMRPVGGTDQPPIFLFMATGNGVTQVYPALPPRHP